MDKSSSKRKRACLAKNCMSGRDKTIQLFALPTDTERCNAWFKLLGKPDLINNPSGHPKNGYVCVRHFHEDDLIKKVHFKLKPDALPFRNLDAEMPTTQSKSLFECAPLTFNSQSVTNSELQCATNFLELEMKQVNDSNAQTDTEIVENDELEQDEDVNISPIDKLRDRIQHEVRVTELTSYDFIAQGRLADIALNFLFSNPAAYYFLQSSLGLPSIQILGEAIIKLPSKAKIVSNLFQVLCLKFKYLPKEAKYCTLCLTEYDLKKHLSYDAANDEVIGYPEVNGVKIEGEPATVAVVATIRGLLTPWLQPVGFCFLSSKNEYMQLDSWIHNIILQLKDIGIEVKAITAPPTEQFFNYIVNQKNVCVTEPNVFQNISFLFDAPQLIKRVRNDLLRNDIIVGDKEVYFEAIHTLLNLESSRSPSIVPKLSSLHVNPQRKLVSTKIAAQTMSRSVAAALRLYIDSKIILESMRPTVVFLQTINDAFDFVNSNETEPTLETEESNHTLIAEQTIDFLSQMKSKSGTDDFYKDSGITGEMFCITIQSTKNLKTFFQQSRLKGFRPRRLNLETVNQLLINLRRSSNEMTCDRFLRIFRTKCIRRLFYVNNSLKPNREKLKDFVKRLNSLPSVRLSAFEKSEVFEGEEDFYDLQLPAIDSRVYISSYLLYMCHVAHSCKTFDTHYAKLQLVDTVRHFQNLNLSKMFCRLMRVPAAFFNTYVMNLDEEFELQFDSLASEPVARKLVEILNTRVPMKYFVCGCFPVDYLLKLYVRIKINLSVKALNNMLDYKN